MAKSDREKDRDGEEVKKKQSYKEKRQKNDWNWLFKIGDWCENAVEKCDKRQIAQIIVGKYHSVLEVERNSINTLYRTKNYPIKLTFIKIDTDSVCRNYSQFPQNLINHYAKVFPILFPANPKQSYRQNYYNIKDKDQKNYLIIKNQNSFDKNDPENSFTQKID